MNGWKASWRIALRHGRRDVAKAKGRSALVVLMVGTPVLLTVLLLVIVSSNDLSPSERQGSELGQAQASLARIEGSDVVQQPDASNFKSSGKTVPLAEAEAGAEKILGTKLGPAVAEGYGNARIGDRGVAVQLRGIDTTSDLTRGMYDVEQGRAPRSPQEILVNRALVDAGASVGSRIGFEGKSFTVVGVGRPDASVRGGSDREAVVLPQDLDVDSTTVLVGGRPVTWPQVRQLNALGYLVTSKYVAEHGISATEQREIDRELGFSVNGGDGTQRAVLVIIATSVMIEIVLLACPAFAVGVRRQRRELALLAATGASPRQVRRVVLGQAAVIGVVTSVVAAVLGIGLGALVVRFGPDVVTAAEFGPFDVTWLAVLLVVVLGTVSAVAAAYVPAAQASRQDVATVLAGRRGEVRTRAGWPILGALVSAAGVAVCFTRGTRPGGEVMVAGSTLAIVVGFVLMTPALVGLVGRLGTNLPLPLRLAARDTARQRSRSAPAVAAVMASVAGITAMAIGSSSDFQQSREEYQYTVAPGRAVVSSDIQDFDRVLAYVDEQTGQTWVPMSVAQDDHRFTNLEALGGAGADASVGTLYVADAATLKAWGVRLSPSDERLLQSGGALSSKDGFMARAGRAQLTVSDDTQDGASRKAGVIDARPADLRYSTMSGPQAPTLHGAVISPATAKRLDLPTATSQAISPPGSQALSESAEQELQEHVAGLSPYGGVDVERGFQESWTVVLLALFGIGGLAVLIGTLTATALALNDAKPDFASLAAIGASPRTRRWAAGSQALVLALLGTVLGVVVGFAPGLAITWPLTAQSYLGGVESLGGPTISIPWMTLAGFVVLVPLGAAAVATVFTRSRLTMVRRVAQ